MKITIETIEHKDQRYNTCGDWEWTAPDRLHIRVSETPKTGWRGAAVVAVHELVEALLCHARGITTNMVDQFDLAFDPVAHDWEPGDDPACPCRFEHNTATGIERILVSEFGLEWHPYETELTQLTDAYVKKETEEDDDR